jgi:hypothetical protein
MSSEQREDGRVGAGRGCQASAWCQEQREDGRWCQRRGVRRVSWVAEDRASGLETGGAPQGRLFAVLRLGKDAPPPIYGACLAVALTYNAEVPLVYKRNRPVGDSGTSFQTTPLEKYLNRRARACQLISHTDSQWQKAPASTNMCQTTCEPRRCFCI